MKLLPYALVLVSAVTHAYWNYLLKSANDKSAFIGLSKVVEISIFAIPFLILFHQIGMPAESLVFIVVAATFTFANYWFLSKAYRGELVLAYPISRSSALFLPLLAYAFIGERIEVKGGLAISLIILGIVLIQLRGRLQEISLRSLTSELANAGSLFALLAAFSAACYTLWDKVAVREIHPFLYFYSYTALVALAFTLTLIFRTPRAVITAEWKRNRWRILQVGFFNTFTYVLVLYALKLSKASYVGALRQVSILFGALLGYRYLGENFTPVRRTAIILLVLGAGLISLAE